MVTVSAVQVGFAGAAIFISSPKVNPPEWGSRRTNWGCWKRCLETGAIVQTSKAKLPWLKPRILLLRVTRARERWRHY